MNILEEIQNCPVEWKELGEVALLKRGKTITSKTATDGPYPVISGGQKPAYFHGEFNREGETITVAGSGAYAGFVMYWDEPIFVSDAFSIEPLEGALIPKFLYHYLLEKQEILFSLKKGSGVPHVYPKDVAKILIPIPPLEIQEKIVQILDKFTEYVTELTSRKKQYSFYRDKLLSFEDEVYQVEWKKLEEVAKFNYGYTDKAKDTGDIRFIRITDIDENGYLKSNDKKYISLTEESRNYLVRHGDLLMARTGATYGKTLFIDTDEASAYASFLIKITPSEKLNSRYYWHFSKSTLYWKQANNFVSKAGQPQFNANSLKNIRIPVPSLGIQSRIVQVLDNFDTVCNDLNIGLPKEIELRQKQYEYFREKLLTFVAEGEYTDSTVQYSTDKTSLGS